MYTKCKEAILARYPDSVVVGSFETATGYIFSIKPKSWKEDEFVLDGMFKVSFDAKTITEYSPVMDPEEFKQALSNRVE